MNEQNASKSEIDDKQDIVAVDGSRAMTKEEVDRKSSITKEAAAE